MTRPGRAAPDRAALLVADIERIPAALEEAPNAEAVATALGLVVGQLGRHGHDLDRIVLTGLGSSRFAAMAVAAALSETRLDLVVEHASTPRPVVVGAGDVVVGISSSGRTPETVAALARARDSGAATLAVTGAAGSPLAGSADGAVMLGAVGETSGIAATSHAATVATVAAVAEALGAPLDSAAVRADGAAAVTDVLARRAAWLADAADALGDGEAVHVIAPAPSLGTAEQTALLFREAPRLAADATEAGDWLHVGIYTALPGYRAVLFAGTAYDEELLAVITRRGGRVLAIRPGQPSALEGFAAEVVLPDLAAGPTPERLVVRALAESAVTALLAAELWRRLPRGEARRPRRLPARGRSSGPRP